MHEIKFREKTYQLINDNIGEGSCGKTVLLFDPQLNQNFACKKYVPDSSSFDFYENFKQEIKILYNLHHNNIVRIYDYYLYPDTGYIIMEYIEGKQIFDYLIDKPHDINSIFEQTILGFKHLEEKQILHRDVRPTNIMITNAGIVKIIDFGFSKPVIDTDEVSNSVDSVLYWYSSILPQEFIDKNYTHATDIFFVGKVFKEALNACNVKNFQYQDLLDKMCAVRPNDRISSFSEINTTLQRKLFTNIDFTKDEREIYSDFTNIICTHIDFIYPNSSYNNSIENIIMKLQELCTHNLLNKNISIKDILNCLFDSSLSYSPRRPSSCWAPVDLVQKFTKICHTMSKNKQELLLKSMQSLFDSHYLDDDNIPF
jgi:serine/threonine protein kinase